MSDELTSPAAPAEPTQTTGTETTVDFQPKESFVNTDGSFKENWQQSLPEDVYKRNRMRFDGMKSMDDLITHINNQDLTISRQDKGIFPPGKDAKEFEVKAFYKALGVPDTPDGYTLNIPEEVQKYYQDEELMAEAKTTLHRLGLTPKQFAGVMALDAQRMQKAEETMQADPMAFYEEALELAMPVMRQEAEKELRLKWGEAFDTRLQLANAAITENTQDGDERNQLLERIGNDPLVADFIATIQNKHHTESHGIDTSLGGGSKFMNVDQQIQALMNNPNYMDGKTNPTEHRKLIEEVNKLLSQKTAGKMVE